MVLNSNFRNLSSSLFPEVNNSILRLSYFLYDNFIETAIIVSISKNFSFWQRFVVRFTYSVISSINVLLKINIKEKTRGSLLLRDKIAKMRFTKLSPKVFFLFPIMCNYALDRLRFIIHQYLVPKSLCIHTLDVLQIKNIHVLCFYSWQANSVDDKEMGVLTDAKTREILPGAEVTLLDKENREVEKAITDDQGRYKFDVICSEDYVVRGTKESYNPT